MTGDAEARVAANVADDALVAHLLTCDDCGVLVDVLVEHGVTLDRNAFVAKVATAKYPLARDSAERVWARVVCTFAGGVCAELDRLADESRACWRRLERLDC